MNLINWYAQTPWHRWWVDNVWKPSWTKFTTAIYGVPAVLIAGMDYAGHLANDEHIKGWIAQLHVPNWIPETLVVVALVHYIASGHDD